MCGCMRVCVCVKERDSAKERAGSSDNWGPSAIACSALSLELRVWGGGLTIEGYCDLGWGG